LIKRSFSFVLAALVVAVLAGQGTASAAGSAPAIAQFNAMFANVNDYTYTLASREMLGTQTQNRVYSYEFLKPSFVKTLILDGDGKGGGGVWTGGNQISGHQGGILSAIHLKVDMNDPRAVSVRGFTMPAGLIQNIVNGYAKIAGALSQGNGGKVGGVDTDRIELKVADVATSGPPAGVTDMILYLNHDTHWPVRQILYAGSQIVLDQTFSDIKTNTGLKPSDFPF
jgi:outer membrane lipoprotein-sorting protein